jgi:hypothetical protein
VFGNLQAKSAKVRGEEGRRRRRLSSYNVQYSLTAACHSEELCSRVWNMSGSLPATARAPDD